MPFVKLDCGFLDSTLWIDRDARDVFLTALLMALPHELLVETRQIEVNSLELTGFTIPPGWYGFVAASGPGIVRRAGLDQEAGLATLIRLGAPENESRTPDFEGRRLVRIDGGYLVLNFIKYREKDATTADRSKRYRERKKERSSRVTPTPSRVIRHQAEAEAEALREEGGGGESRKARIKVVNEPPAQPDDLFPSTNGTARQSLPDQLVERWNRLPPPFPKIKSLSSGRATALRARSRDPFWLQSWKLAIDLIEASDFCRGQNDRGWVADVDFFLRPDTLTKVMEGKYNKNLVQAPLRASAGLSGEELEASFQRFIQNHPRPKYQLAYPNWKASDRNPAVREEYHRWERKGQYDKIN